MAPHPRLCYSTQTKHQCLHTALRGNNIIGQYIAAPAKCLAGNMFFKFAFLAHLRNIQLLLLKR